MNLVFVSPNFPRTYWNFCDRLAADGVNVLGIGDAPYETLEQGLRDSLTEYYRVEALDDYDEMFRAVAFLSFKYGHIDWLESNNEFWLESDARLRTDFNITTGVGTDEIQAYKSKSGMKAFYERAHVPSARCHRVSTRTAALAFVDEVGGYPVFAKPDVGVGAEGTYKIDDASDLERFFSDKPDVQYVMEEFVSGDIYSYDAIVDSHGDPLFENSCWFPPSMAEIVEGRLDFTYRALPDVPAQLRQRGRAVVKAFGVRSRFVHMEFFRLSEDHTGLGEKGDFVGLEVNMRPAGGYTPDMMNIAHAIDVYQIWADMIAFDRRRLPVSKVQGCCVYVGRRDIHSYVHPLKEVLDHYEDDIEMAGRMPDALADDMCNQYLMAWEPDMRTADVFRDYAMEQAVEDTATSSTKPSGD
ncbi:MAG: hypothetical protein LKI25_02335 [Atopobiaceae bacterium]|jgi:hypothetical protein|nr:hypothetical protein [Atopobiaceae bacterium]MCI2173045.1 hypothetical protein [Atopobiaceae bacterium]MCI2208138.1 hypothetical protein [Atopobiaceae bacterium]